MSGCHLPSKKMYSMDTAATKKSKTSVSTKISFYVHEISMDTAATKKSNYLHL